VGRLDLLRRCGRLDFRFMDRDTVDEIKRAFGVIAEDLRSDVRAVAEGQAQLRGEFDGFREEFNTFRVEVRKEFDTFRADVRNEFEQTRETIRLSHGELERRIVDLETGTS